MIHGNNDLVAFIHRVVAEWSGGKIGSGFSSFFFDAVVGDAQDAVDAVKSLFTGVYGLTGTELPSGITIAFPASVDVLEESNGELQESISVTKPADTVGAASSAYAAAAGAVITWLTAAVIGGQRLRGRTFFVPVAGVGLDTQGTLSPVMLAQLNSAGTQFVASAAQPVVWHRPTGPTAVDGDARDITGFRVQDKAAILTSRR